MEQDDDEACRSERAMCDEQFVKPAEEILDHDPDLAAHAQLRDEVEDLLGDAVEFLFKS